MSSSSSPSSSSSLQLWFLPELKRAFPLAEDWLLDGLSQTCVASASVEEMCDAMRNFIGEEAVADALRLSEMLFEKKKDYQGEKKKTSSPSSLSRIDDGDVELKLRKVKEKTTTSDDDGGKEEDQKKGEAKAYRKYDSIEKPSCTNDQTSSKATNSVVREHRSILVKMSKKKSSSGEDVGKRKDRMKNPGDALEVGDLLKPRAANCLRCGKIFRFDLDASGAVAENDARVFLESSGKCTFCDAFVNVKLRDGLVWNGGIGYATEQEEDTEGGKAAAERLKDQLVSFDRSGASRTKVVDDQSEWYDHGDVDAEAWLAEDERRALKHKRDTMDQQQRDRELAKKRTFGIDILGRKTMILDEEELQLIRERDERAKLAMESAALNSMSEFAQGGGSAVATAAETARELESRLVRTEQPTSEIEDLAEERKVRVPKNKTLNLVATFVKSFKDIASSNAPLEEKEKHAKKNDNDDDALSRLEADAPRRVLDINPFDQIAQEAADAGLGFVL
ncbi:unnamed protein product [Bathycoccus prasinos]|jgi:hypothetical protein